MLHAKFPDHRTSSFEEEDFKFCIMYGCNGHLGNWDWTWTFVPPSHGCSTCNLALLYHAVSEKIFKSGGRRTDDGLTPKDGYTIRSPCELSAQVSL